MRSEDIAKLAGVSRSTVSRVINHYANVPEHTRIKVLKVIEQYQYEPNTSARVLAGKSTETIGLFVVSTAESPNAHLIYQNGYFAPFVDAVVDTANALGYYVLIHTVYSHDDFVKVKQAFQQKRIDGGIMIGTQEHLAAVLDIIGFGMPFVLIDADLQGVIAQHQDKNHLAVINSKDYEGTRLAIEYLIGLGHRDIGMIQGRMSTFSGNQRFRAFMDTMDQHGLTVADKHILHGEFLSQAARMEVERMVSSGNLPTALFCANDAMAMAALEVFKAHELRVPQDISVIGFDDVAMASVLTPSLTTVRLPIFDMSEAAAKTLIRMCEKGSESFQTFSFPSKLVIRNSCQSMDLSINARL